MMQTSTNSERDIVESRDHDEALAAEENDRAAHERTVARLRLLWEQRRFLFRFAGYGLVVVTLIAFLIPKRYESSARLMPPDNQSSSGLALLAGLTAKTGGGLGGFAGDLLGFKSSGALFIGILRSRTVEDRLVERFHLQKVYGARLSENARKKLAENTAISEDRKSGIIAVSVTDHSPQRAAALGNAYLEELNRLVAELTTSAAHRERVFLEERLKTVKLDLDAAAQEFSNFASKNISIDIKEQGRAMVEAAATLQGNLIATQSELEGLRQIYTDNNLRVRAVRARIAEVQHQLEKLGGQEATGTGGTSQPSETLYPSIRKLPLLGVKYADLYRRTKIQEAVYETLTQQYELTKVQEAKETPSVKVLDAAEVPEKRSFPPRLLIMFLGTVLSFAFAVLWVLGSARWAEMDPKNPGRLLAQEVFTTLQAHTPWLSRNGHRLATVPQKIWSRFGWRNRQTERGED